MVVTILTPTYLYGSSIGTSKTISFPFGTNGKLMFFRCLNIKLNSPSDVV